MVRKEHIITQIPYAKKLIYTLYSQGCLIEIPNVDSEEQDFIYFKYLYGTVAVLFYEYRSKPRNIRRAYIVTNWNEEDSCEPIDLPGVNVLLKPILIAKGHEVDRLKKCMYWLSEKNEDKYKVFTLPLLFWYKLAGLIEYTLANEIEVKLLFEKYVNESKEE